MSGGSTTQHTTQNTITDPYAPAKPALQTILDGAANAYASGVGSQVYGGPRVAGLGANTVAGLDSMVTNAGGSAGAAKAGNDYLTGLLANGGSTSGISDAVKGLMGVQGVDTSGVASVASRMADPNNAANTVGHALTGGEFNLDGSGYADLAKGLGTGTQTQRSLQDAADGKFLGGANPYLEDVISRGSNAAASKVGQSFAASGRYGSGRFSGAVADAVDGVNTNLRYQDYDAERTRQANAAAAIDSAANARTGVQAGLLGNMNDVRSANAGQAVTGAGLVSGADSAALTGANTLASLQAANNAQQIGQYGTALASGQSDRAASMAGIGQVATSNDNLLQQGRTLAQVGTAQDAARQQEIDAARELFTDQQSAPWKQLGLYSGLAVPISGLGGTSNTQGTVQTPQPSMFQQIFGGLLAAGGTAANAAARLGAAALI